ncbi:MAG: methionine--tRNA ligase [Bdellovibrionales bacterium]|nr:methionine--tRNA ligase [Bdellovibrionales bacterium]
MNRLLVTAALPYSNGRLHVGHIAGCFLPADIFVRFERMRGKEVRFVCGSDDHGVAIKITAEKEGKTPAEVAKFYSDHQEQDFAGLGIHFDVYGSTSRTKYHFGRSQQFFMSLFEKGYFEKKKSEQFYDESKGAFLPDRYVKGTCGYCDATDQYGDQCENCGKVLDVSTLKDAVSVLSGSKATIRETTHWFIDLSKSQSVVEEWLKSSEVRDHTRKYVSGLLSTGLVQRSMTRDLDWGIPVPLDDPEAAGKVLYVWFDAPIGYISNTEELCEERDGDSEKYVDWWKSKDCSIYHFIGEDNTIFHCVIWIAMLAAEGSYQLPTGVFVNQYLNIQFPDKEAEKISKSRGNAVWIGDYLEKGGSPDSLRYYLTAIAPERARSIFKPDDLVQRNNTDLANVIGNFVNRILSFTKKHVGDTSPQINEQKLEDTDREFRALRKSTHGTVTELLEGAQTKGALEAIMEYARACNKYVDDMAPWATRKTDMARTELTLAVAIEAIAFLGVMLNPFLPFASEKLLRMLSISVDALSWDDALKGHELGITLGETEILFSKMELSDWIPEREGE